MNGESKQGRGRPRKEHYERAHNSADASLALIEKHTKIVVAAMELDPKFSPAFEHLSPIDRVLLAREIAYELSFYPAMLGLIDTAPKHTTGPKPKTATTLFLTQTRTLLQRYGVTLQQWQNARAARNDLVDFCLLLLTQSGARPGVISARTARTAPLEGFTSGRHLPPFAMLGVCFATQVFVLQFGRPDNAP